MTRWRIWLAILALAGGALLMACSDSKDDDDGNGGDGPTATESADEGDETPDDSGNGDGANTPDDSGNGNGDGAFDDIPVPDGADEVDSGTYSGAQVPIIDPSGSVDASTFGDVQYRTYETSDSGESVINFYSDQLSGWDEKYKLSGGSGEGSGAFGIWTKDDGRTALWVGASEIDGNTTVVVILGSAD